MNQRSWVGWLGTVVLFMAACGSDDPSRGAEPEGEAAAPALHADTGA